MDRLLILWIAAAVVFAVIEAATAQILTLWFCIGSIGAIIAYALGASLTVQIIVFVAVSLLTLLIARPYLRRFMETKKQPTNLDMCVGQDALVTERISNLDGTGQAKIRGVVWTARSSDDSVIEPGEKVKVLAIEGVKLIVAPIAPTTEA